MVGLIARIALVIAGFFTSFFVSKDALNFPIIQMIIAVSMSTLVISIIAFWPELKIWYKNKRTESKL